jgi:hypothetical protein
MKMRIFVKICLSFSSASLTHTWSVVLFKSRPFNYNRGGHQNNIYWFAFSNASLAHTWCVVLCKSRPFIRGWYQNNTYWFNVKMISCSPINLLKLESRVEIKIQDNNVDKNGIEKWKMKILESYFNQGSCTIG